MPSSAYYDAFFTWKRVVEKENMKLTSKIVCVSSSFINEDLSFFHLSIVFLRMWNDFNVRKISARYSTLYGILVVIAIDGMSTWT